MDNSKTSEQNTNESILMSVKTFIGDSPYSAYDADIIMHINSTIVTLRQMGVTPPKGFVVRDERALWTDYVSDIYLRELVKEFICLSVRMIFDPPSSSIVSDAVNNRIKETSWRIIHLIEIEQEGF